MSGSAAAPGLAPGPGTAMRRQRLALFASLGLNLLLLGFLAAHHVHGRWHGPGGHSVAAMFDHVTAGLSASDAAIVRKAFNARQADFATAQRGYAAAAENVRAALQAEPFDVQRLRASLEAAHQARALLGPLVEGVMLQAAPALSPEGRRLLARTQGR